MVSKNSTKSKTLPPTKQLSNSFSSPTYDNHDETNESSGVGGSGTSQAFRHATPKIKSPATIGVASGFSISETLKKLTNNLMTNNGRHDSANVSSSLDQTTSGEAGTSSRRRSVTRIISSDSLKNLKTVASFKSGSSSSSNSQASNSLNIYSARYNFFLFFVLFCFFK